MLRCAELWSIHLGTLERREWGVLHDRLRQRVAADQLPDLLVTLEHPRARGRLLGSVIMRVDDAIVHAQRVEQAVVGALTELGVQPHPHVERPAIWVRDRRIGLLAGHDGFAIGVDHPADSATTSLRCETGQPVSLRSVRRVLTQYVSRAHARDSVDVAPEWLGEPLR